MSQSPLGPGKLLVAARALVDPNFSDSVILLIDADDDGARGVVLNRPSRVPIAQVLDGWADVVSEPRTFFVGGPVGPEGVLAVGALRPEAQRIRRQRAHDTGRGPRTPVGFRPISGALGLVDLDSPIADMTSHLESLRIFAGYSGWSAGQLESEIDQGAWHVVPGQSRDLFGAETDGLWRGVLRRQPGELAWASTQPLDPQAN